MNEKKIHFPRHFTQSLGELDGIIFIYSRKVTAESSTMLPVIVVSLWIDFDTVLSIVRDNQIGNYPG